MNKINLRSSSLLIFAIFLFITSTILAYIFFKNSPIADGQTLILIISLELLMATALWKTRNRPSYDSLLVLAFTMCFFFFPRLLQYLAVKQENLKLLYLLFPMPWTSADINYGLTYVVLGTLLIIAALLTAESVYYRFSRNKIGQDLFQSHRIPTLKSLIATGVVIYVVEGYYIIYLGLSASSNCNLDVAGKWLIHFFSGDVYILIVIVALVSQYKSLLLKYKVYLYVSLVIYSGYLLLLGSRGATLRLLIIGICLAIACYRDFRIRLVTLLILIPIVGVISVQSYFLGTAIREFKRYNCGSDKMFSFSEPERDTVGYEANEKFVAKYRNDVRNVTKFNLPPEYARILDRLGVIDYAIGIVTMKPDPAVKETYINYSYPLKNLANNLIIGVPYPEAEKMTNNLMPMLYRNLPLQHVLDNFVSEPYTIWGLAYLYYGYVGGLIFIFIGMFLLQLAYIYGSHKFGAYTTLYKATYLWIVMNGAFFITMGFDHAIILVIYMVMQILTTLLILYGFETMFRRITRRSLDKPI